MKKIVGLTLLLMTVSIYSYAFEYRIVSKTPDSRLNGAELLLNNEIDWVGEPLGIVENGVIDIKGNSERSFPARLIITDRAQNPNGSINYNIDLIVEPGTIFVDVNEYFPLSGGVLNQGYKACAMRITDVEYKTVARKEILKEYFLKNIGNGLGEKVLLDYGWICSPDEWAEMTALLDAETRSFAAIENLTERKERMKGVWEGEPYAELNGKNLDGEAISLSEFVGKGKYVVADFWTSWCGGCIVEAKKYLKPIYEEYKDDPNVIFLGVGMDDISEAVDKLGIEWEQINECKRLMATYGVYSIPEIVLFAPDGIILRRFVRGSELKQLLKDILPQKQPSGDYIGGKTLQ